MDLPSTTSHRSHDMKGEHELIEPIRAYVRAYGLRHGRRRATEAFGVSRHTLWRFLERGYVGRSLCPVRS